MTISISIYLNFLDPKHNTSRKELIDQKKVDKLNIFFMNLI